MSTASKTKMTAELDGFERRGCWYAFEHFEDNAYGEHVVTIDCWNSRGSLLWSGYSFWDDGDNVALVLRRGKESANIAASDRRAS